MEDLSPLRSFKEFNDLHLLWFGWPQQMPAHRAMKARYGITNLMQEWPVRGPFDLIFCRNVVIYFDKPTQRKLFARFAEKIAPRGYLIIGHSETLYNVSEEFELVGRTIYRKLA